MKSLAIKYRPQIISDAVGQENIVKILNKIIEKQAYKNAYLFAGPSGCGKTSLSRCFARAINGSLDGLVELDAASSGSIDHIRAIVDSANQRSLTSVYKIFIIDEAHAISTAGFQVFLKCLEECPEYTIFIFCTTEPNKIPATVLNRMQRFNIAKIQPQEIKNRLVYICQQEGFTNYEDTCELISKLCDGCMREAITKLDQCADLSTDLSLENTKFVLGEAPFERMLKLTNCLINKQPQFTLIAIETLANEGKDLKQFVNEYLSFTLEMTKYILFKNIGLTNIPAYLENSADPMISVSATVNFDSTPEGPLPWFNSLANKLLEVKNAIKYDTNIKAVVEAYFLQICNGM